MICQPAIFVMGFPDARVSSSVILVYGVTIRWLHFAHAQSIYTRPLDQKEVWSGDEATVCPCTCIYMSHVGISVMCEMTCDLYIYMNNYVNCNVCAMYINVCLYKLSSCYLLFDFISFYDWCFFL